MQWITLGEKTISFGPAGPPASPEEGLRLVQDFQRIERGDLRKEILTYVTEVLRVQDEKGGCDSANDNRNMLVMSWAANAKNSVDVAMNAALTWKLVQSQLAVARAQIAQLKGSISEFKLPNSEMAYLRRDGFEEMRSAPRDPLLPLREKGPPKATDDGSAP